MPTVCLYFQLHQPYRLRRYSVFDTDRHYFDDFKNAEFLRKVADRCYLPITQLLLDQIRDTNGEFRFGLSISGVLLEQFEDHVPEVIVALKKLVDTGSVELLNETYYHTLAFLYSREEFRHQVEMHREKIKQLFGQESRVFRNTALIFNNELADFVAHMGYEGCLAEGVDSVLGLRTPNNIYTPPSGSKLKVLLNNSRLCDDISFRFTDTTIAGYPMTPTKFANRISQINAHGEVCNLFLNFETFGDYYAADTGIIDFLKALPKELLVLPQTTFATPSQVIDSIDAVGVVDTPHLTSWEDPEHDLSTWLGNAMQSNALHELYKLESKLKAHGDRGLITDWRKLGTSDHFYYMCTKFWADHQSPRYLSPYESPYDSYINFMNVLDNIQSRVRLT